MGEHSDATGAQSDATGEHSARVTKTVAADRPLVWEAFTSADALASWFWPPRFATTATMDAREGGAWSIRSAPTAMGASGTVLRAVEPERLELTWRWDGEAEETRVAVTLVEVVPAAGEGGTADGAAGATTITVVHDGFASEEAAADHVEGWSDCLDRLAARLDSQRTV